MPRRITDHGLFKALQYWWPKLTIIGSVLGFFWWASGVAHSFTDSLSEHLRHGAQIVEEQKKTNQKLDVLIKLQAARTPTRTRITGNN